MVLSRTLRGIFCRGEHATQPSGTTTDRAGVPIADQPGVADEMLRELGPLLAEDGIDVNNIDVPDLDTFQNAMNRERRRHGPVHPGRRTRELAVGTLRLAVQGINADNSTLAGAVLEQVEPESPDDSAPTASACIGVALGLLDDWLSGTIHRRPQGWVDRLGRALDR